MNKMGLWFYLSCKRQLKRPVFFLLLLCLPVGMWLFHGTEEKSSGRIAIALFTEDDSWNEEVAGELTEKEGSFEFYRCTTEAELVRDVETGKAECGYIFPAGLKEKLSSGAYKKTIMQVSSPSTVAAKLAAESVFAGLFRVYAKTLLKDYASGGKAFENIDTDVWTELEPLYKKYLENGSTFAFTYTYAGGKTMEKTSVKAVFPVKGICAVFIFIMGLAAAVTTAEDEKRGLFVLMPKGKKHMAMAAELSAPVMLSCLSALFCLIAVGAVQNPEKEVLFLFVYGLLAAAFAYVLLAVIKNPSVLAGLIPFFIIASLAACPVFADLSAFVPFLAKVRCFLPPYYYLIM